MDRCSGFGRVFLIIRSPEDCERSVLTSFRCLRRHCPGRFSAAVWHAGAALAPARHSSLNEKAPIDNRHSAARQLVARLHQSVGLSRVCHLTTIFWCPGLLPKVSK